METERAHEILDKAISGLIVAREKLESIDVNAVDGYEVGQEIRSLWEVIDRLNSIYNSHL